MTDPQSLLDLQRCDNELDQLRYRNENLPERTQLADLAAEERSLVAAMTATEAQRDELRRRERQIEDDAADIKAKAASFEGRLYDGSVTSPKEAAAIGDEIAGLRHRQSSLEDQAIELLIEVEPLDAQLEAARVESERMSARRSDLEASIAEAEASIAAESATATAKRDAATAGIAPDVLEDYRKLRITYGPDAVVEFDPGRGGGCPVAMSAVELDRWKHLPAGTLGPCTDCGRLVAKLA